MYKFIIGYIEIDYDGIGHIEHAMFVPEITDSVLDTIDEVSTNNQGTGSAIMSKPIDDTLINMSFLRLDEDENGWTFHRTTKKV